jgi:hypothetical protein
MQPRAPAEPIKSRQDTLQRSYQRFTLVLSLCGGPCGMVELVDPIRRLGWTVFPGRASVEDQVNIPGEVACAAQCGRHLPPGELVWVMEVGQAGMLEPSGGSLRRRSVICIQNVDPHQAGAHLRRGRQPLQHTLHRTGALQAFRSGRRDESQHPDEARPGVEIIDQRLKVMGERDQFHRCYCGLTVAQRYFLFARLHG